MSWEYPEEAPDCSFSQKKNTKRIEISLHFKWECSFTSVAFRALLAHLLDEATEAGRQEGLGRGILVNGGSFLVFPRTH